MLPQNKDFIDVGGITPQLNAVSVHTVKVAKINQRDSLRLNCFVFIYRVHCRAEPLRKFSYS